MMEASEVLKATAVTKSFGLDGDRILALKDVDLDCGRGEVVALVGTNGSGKSTLLNVCAGLITADSGRVSIAGRDVMKCAGRDLAQLRGIVYQQPTRNLCRGFSVAEMVDVYGHSGDARTRIEENLSATGIAPFRRVTELSGGQQQILALDLVLSRRPLLLLLDEPTAALDVKNATTLRRRVRSAASEGLAVVLISHDLDEAAELCDRLCFMDAGEIVHVWDRQQLADGGVDAVRSAVTGRSHLLNPQTTRGGDP